MKKIIGENKKGEVVYSGNNLLNDHVIACGKSGCGKTTAVLNLLLQEAEAGEQVIVFNWRNCMNPETLHPSIRERYEKNVHVIDVARNGIEIPLFTKHHDLETGSIESDFMLRERIVLSLARSNNLTEAQSRLLHSAVQDIFDDGSYQELGIKALGNWLNAQKNMAAQNLSGKLYSFIGGNLFRNGDFLQSSRNIIEVDLNSLEAETQKKVLVFILDYLYRLSHRGVFLTSGLSVFVDEAQNLDYGQGSTMFALINEARKLNFKLFAAFPSFFTGVKKDMRVLTQAGTALYFTPISTERNKLAKIIDPREVESKVYILSKLVRGEFICCSSYAINGTEYSKPIVLKSLLAKVTDKSIKTGTSILDIKPV